MTARTPDTFLRRKVVIAAAWLACLSVMYALVVAVDFPIKDADSTLYESIGASLAEKPVSEWIVPQWPPNRVKTGPFVEHTAGLFWLPAALGRLGFTRGALLANFVYFLFSLYLIFLLTRSIASVEAGWIAVVAYVISPIGLQYLLRANHETAWGLGFLGGLWCLAGLRRSRWFGAGFVCFALWSVLVKGALALTFFPVMLVWWWFVSRRGSDLVWFAAALAAVGLEVAFYELAYRSAAGTSFLAQYWGIQTGYAAGYEHHGIAAKLRIPPYYFVTAMWFSLPSSLLLLACLFRGSWREKVPVVPRNLLLGSGGTYLALLSLMSRSAARYVFPVFAMAHPAGAATLLELQPRVREWLKRHEAAMPWLMIALMLVITPLCVGFNLKFSTFYRVRDLLQRQN